MATVKSSSLTAVIVGATGLVGLNCLKALLNTAQYSRVIAVTRKPLVDIEYNDKLINLCINFDDLGSIFEDFKVDHAFCCLGTTIAVAGTKAEFHKVDYRYVMDFANAVYQKGCQHFLVVTALGANANSAIFYNRVKGSVEKDLSAVGFSQLSIFQPSMLVGERSESRLVESLGKRTMMLFQPFMRGPLSAIHPINASDVANAMVTVATQMQTSGIVRYQYREMQSFLNVDA